MEFFLSIPQLFISSEDLSHRPGLGDAATGILGQVAIEDLGNGAHPFCQIQERP
jgi:hypothetical protein